MGIFDWKEKAKCCLKENDFEGAVLLYQKCLENDPTNDPMEEAKLYGNIAFAYLKLNDYSNVITNCGKALELDPNYTKAYYRRSQAFMQLNKLDCAVQDLRKATCIVPNDKCINKALEEALSLKKDNGQGDNQQLFSSFLDPKESKKRSVVNVKKVTFTKSKKKLIPHPIESFVKNINITSGSESPGLEDSANISPKLQKEMIQVLIHQAKERGLRLGDKWYLLEVKWWNNWCKYVGYHNENIDINFSGNLPPIDNRRLCTKNGTLQKNIVENNDFVFVPVEVWKALFEWYGGGPTFAQGVVLSKNGQKEICLQVSQSKNIIYHGEVCTACGGTGGHLSRCTSCKKAAYCNRNCQVSHWKFHSKLCKSDMEISAMVDWRGRRGVTGLVNLGNTCFMNSALQCLSHTYLLTKHFLSNSYQHDLNEINVLGTGGKLAKAYDALIKELWFGAAESFTPTHFKTAISRFAPRFSGFQQHDSQELLAYLLDGLHEDLNLVKKKPYVESLEANGRCDWLVAKEAWINHQRRNQSIFVDHFQGQFKSTVVCPNCSTVSITFDPFNCVQLELPVVDKRTFLLNVVPRSTNSAVRYSLQLCKKASIKTLKIELSKLCNIDPMNMIVADVFNSHIYAFFNDFNPVSKIRDDDTIFIYEAASSSSINIFAQHRGPTPTGKFEFFGYPILVSVVKTKSLTLLTIFKDLLTRLRPFFDNDEVSKVHNNFYVIYTYILYKENCRDLWEEFDQHIVQTFLNGSTISPLDMEDPDKLAHEILNFNERYLFFVVDWNGELGKKINRFAFEDIHDDLSVGYHRRSRLKSYRFTLDDCFQKFCRPEKLDSDNPWYCSKCSKHQQATKTLQLWKIPDVLILSLKRFEYHNHISREKLDAPINFPLQLDMSKYCLQSPLNNSKKDVVMDDSCWQYDLYAVVNHFGGMLSGHYTAFARQEESSKWFCFDDSRVTPIHEDQVQSNAAYILFYKRRQID